MFDPNSMRMQEQYYLVRFLIIGNIIGIISNKEMFTNPKFLITTQKKFNIELMDH